MWAFPDVDAIESQLPLHRSTLGSRTQHCISFEYRHDTLPWLATYFIWVFFCLNRKLYFLFYSHAKGSSKYAFGTKNNLKHKVYKLLESTWDSILIT